jgi:phosphoribosyl-dephospho-CoA transferase
LAESRKLKGEPMDRQYWKGAMQLAAKPPATARPHDLLWLRPGARVLGAGSDDFPAWAREPWMALAPVVVRREKSSGAVPVGLRGRLRRERCKDWLAPADVARTVTPEMLAADAGWQGHPDAGLPALAALAAVAPLLKAIGLPWGPSGGAGFTLASGFGVLRPDSDLDLLVRAGEALDGAGTAALMAVVKAGMELAGCRIDIQVDTGYSGFALAEWARIQVRGRGKVMLKTATGPVLTGNPWREGR